MTDDKGLGEDGSNNNGKDVTSSEDTSEIELIDLTSQWIRRMECMITSRWMVIALANVDSVEETDEKANFRQALL